MQPSTPPAPATPYAFDHHYYEQYGTMEVVLHFDFKVDQWEDFQKNFSDQLKQDTLKWDLDLRQIRFISSMILGLIVGFNTIVRGHSGILRVITTRNSQVSQLLKPSRLNYILKVVEF
jgi:anti-anti-sigma regulatory factor